MSLAAAAPRRQGLRVSADFGLTAAALLLIAVAIQLRFGMMADVSWLIEADEKWRAGGAPYRDILELNPPASLLLYWPAVALAQTLGLASEAVVSASGFLTAGVCLGLGGLILRDSRSAGPGLALTAIFAAVVLPGQTFCERDHLAALFALPFLALALARAEGLKVAAPLAILAGLLAGAMAAVKPPYALIPALLALYQWRRRGLRAALTSPEYYAAAALGLVYVASVGRLFPAYVENVLPFNVDVYVAVREPMAALIASPGALTFLLIAAAAALTAGERAASPGFVVALLATAAAGVSYFIQGKGWVYQAIPGMMFATLAAPFALEEATPLALAAAVAVAAVAVPGLHSLGLGLALGAVAGLAAEAALRRALPLSLQALAPMLCAAAIGAAAGLCTIERPLTPKLEARLATLGSGRSVATISEDEGLGFPLVRRLHDRWALRAHSLIVTAGVRRLIDECPGDAARATRLTPYATRDRAILLQDLARERPDALLIGPLGTRLNADLMADPALRAAMADYLRVETEQTPDYAAELWLRRDLAAH